MNANWGVVFDMDGVIVDNKKFHFEAWRRFTVSHGLNFDEQVFKYNFFGRSNEEILQGLFGRPLSKDAIICLAQEKESLYRQLYSGQVRPARGLKSFLEKLQSADIPLAVATAAPRENLEFVLIETGLKHYFKVCVDESLVSQGKPAPDIYLRTANLLQLPPARCLAFEDSLPGITSARRAGLRVIALTTSHQRLELNIADLVIDHFEQIEPETVKNIIESASRQL